MTNEIQRRHVSLGYLPKPGGCAQEFHPMGYDGGDIQAFIAARPHQPYQWLYAVVDGKRVWENPDAHPVDLDDGRSDPDYFGDRFIGEDD